MADNELIIEVIGDNSRLTRVLRDSERKTSRFAKSLDQVGAGRATAGRGQLASSAALLRGGGYAVAAGVALQAVSELTSAASDLNEQVTKNQAVFGDSAQSILAWSDTTAKALGISKTEALEAAGTFGNLFSTVGVGAAQASQMSQSLVKLASDLASFNNADPSEVLDAIRSGLIGEAEPMRRFGALLSEARVQQQAMADTGKSNAKALTDQEKVTARYELILKDTVAAQGDFAATSGGLANQQRILQAQLSDTRAELGAKLLPIQLKVVTALNEGIGAAEKFGHALGQIKGPSGLEFISNGLDDINDALDKSNEIWPDWLNNVAELSAIDIGRGIIDWFSDAEDAATDATAAANQFRQTMQGLGALDLNPFNAPTILQPHPAAPTFPDLGFGGTPPPRTATPQQRNQWFDTMISRELVKVQDVRTLSGQVQRLHEIGDLVEERLAVTKDITRRNTLQDQLDEINRRALATQAAAADANAAAAKQAADAATRQADAERERLRKLREAEAARRQALQFRAIGLGPTGGEIVPQVANLKRQLAQLTARTDIGDLPSKMAQQLKGARRVLNRQWGAVTEDSRSAIRDLFDAIRQELNKGLQKAGGPLTATTQLSEKIMEGLGLSGDQERILRARLSHFNSAGVALAGAGTGTLGVTVPVTVNMDGRVVATTSAKYNRRGRAVNPSQRNGPNAGLVIS